jgi:aspartate aminotransferase-like enzyme
MDLNMDEWNVDVVVSASQKAFMIPPGLSFMAFNDRALGFIAKKYNHKFYWDITGLKYLEKGQTPLLPPYLYIMGYRNHCKNVI